jgi:hypothetical protein
LVPVLSLRVLAASFIRLGRDHAVLIKDYPCSDYLEKLPDPSFNYFWVQNMPLKLSTLHQLDQWRTIRRPFQGHLKPPFS